MRALYVIAIVLIVGVGALTAKRIQDSNAARAAVPEKTSDALLIRSAKVEKRGVDESVTFTGSILPKNEVDIFPKLPGRIETLSVQVGDKVKAGQLLAEVEHREIGWQAKSAEAAAQAAQASLKIAEANLDGARLSFNRTKALFDGGSAPQAQLDGARVQQQAADAQLLAAQAQVAQAEAAKGLAEQQLSNARIETPISGVVTKRTVNIGVSAGQQMPAFTVQDVDTLKLESSVQASVFARLKRGMPVDITVDSFPGEIFHGKVDVLSPSLDPQTRRAAVDIAIDNANGRLLPHMFAHADVTVGHVDDAVVVPKEAVLEAAGGSIVYRIRSGKVEAVHPEFGPESGNLVSIVKGLEVGDEVAISSLGNLSDGAAVRVSVAVSQKD
jgi:RND family efflux transporter MFP subunit